MLWSLLRSSLPEHLQHLGRSIGAIASVQHVLCVGHDKSARLVSSEESTHFKSRTGDVPDGGVQGGGVKASPGSHNRAQKRGSMERKSHRLNHLFPENQCTYYLWSHL